MAQKIDYALRLEEIKRFADAIEDRRTDLQEAAAFDAGFPMKITALETDLALQHLRTMEEELDWVRNAKPYGTVAAIFPYDAPVVMLARLGGAALLTGNRLRFSFSSMTPRTAAIMSEICRPFSSLEPVVHQDNREYGRRCVEDNAVRVLFMSGASAVGEAYREKYQAFDKLFFAGPGGMPAAVVFEDADAEKASRFIARRAFINGGQYCTTLKKALIHRKLYQSVRSLILEHSRCIKVGDPLDPETDVGPIRVQRTLTILQNALKECSKARRLSGSIEGEKVFPLVIETDEPAIPDLELFGPFLLLKPFDDPTEVTQELIRTRYGFLLAFFGSAPEDSRSLFTSNFGMVFDNPEFFFTPMRHPFGGKKASGWILERQGDGWVERDGAFLYSKELVRPMEGGH